MFKHRYSAPSMELIEFSKEDAVCTASMGWEVTGPGGDIGGGGITTERPGELPDEITG